MKNQTKTKGLNKECAICNHRLGVHNQMGGCDDCWKEYKDNCKNKDIPMSFGMPERHYFKSKELK